MTIYFIKYANWATQENEGYNVEFFLSLQDCFKRMVIIQELAKSEDVYLYGCDEEGKLKYHVIQWHGRDTKYLVDKLNEINKLT